MNAAYNSEDNAEWVEYREEMDCPANSMESTEVIDFHSSSEEEPVEMGDIAEALDKMKAAEEVVMYCRVNKEKISRKKKKKGQL